MEFKDVIEIDTPRERIWDVLQDTQTLGDCIPGLEEVEVSEGGRAISGTASVNLGPSSMQLPARVQWLEQDAPGYGKLRAVATVAQYEVHGDGTFELVETAREQTRLSWTATVTIPPQLGQNRMMEQLVRTLAGHFIRTFFECLQARLAG